MTAISTDTRNSYCLSHWTELGHDDRDAELDVIGRFKYGIEGPMRSTLAQVAAETGALILEFDEEASIGMGYDGELEALTHLSVSGLSHIVNMARTEIIKEVK